MTSLIHDIVNKLTKLAKVKHMMAWVMLFIKIWRNVLCEVLFFWYMYLRRALLGQSVWWWMYEGRDGNIRTITVRCNGKLFVRSVTKPVFTLQVLPDARTVRERHASGCPCTHCVHCVGFVGYTQTTSGGVLSGRERYASGWRCSVNARVDASGTAATRRLRMYAD